MYAVTPWRVLIERRGAHSPISYRSLQQMLHVVKAADFNFDGGPFGKLRWFTFLFFWAEKISDGLDIDLVAAQGHFELWLFI